MSNNIGNNYTELPKETAKTKSIGWFGKPKKVCLLGTIFTRQKDMPKNKIMLTRPGKQ